jgi:hypothetical protein
VIEANVVQAIGDETRGMGLYRFLTAPAIGERLRLGTVSGVDFYRVLNVEHQPVSLPVNAYSKPDPSIMVFVSYDGSWSPDD